VVKQRGIEVPPAEIDDSTDGSIGISTVHAAPSANKKNKKVK